MSLGCLGSIRESRVIQVDRLIGRYVGSARVAGTGGGGFWWGLFGTRQTGFGARMQIG